MEPIWCPETSARNYHSTLPKIPKECRFHLHRGGILESFLVSLVRQDCHGSPGDRLKQSTDQLWLAVNWPFFWNLVILWLRRLVSGLSPYRPGFTTKPVLMVFVVDRVAFGQVSLPVFQFSRVTVIPSLLCTSNSFHNHRRCTTSVIDSVITQNTFLSLSLSSEI